MRLDIYFESDECYENGNPQIDWPQFCANIFFCSVNFILRRKQMSADMTIKQLKNRIWQSGSLHISIRNFTIETIDRNHTNNNDRLIISKSVEHRSISIVGCKREQNCWNYI